MKTRIFIFIALFCGLVGTLFFLIQRNWLIVQFTGAPSVVPAASTQQNLSSQKAVRLYYWKNDKWHHDEVSIIWGDCARGNNIKQLIKQWLILLQEEHIVAPHIMLQSVTLDASGNNVFVSFDHLLFSRDWSIMKKWQIFQGLCKTLHYAEPKIQKINLLINHQPLEDDHLDFSQALPVIERS